MELDRARVAIVTDSSACLPSDVVARLGVLVVPIEIRLGATDISDGSADASRRVYEALARREPVKSSAPSPLRYLAAVEECDTDDVLIVTPAMEFTTMHASAVVAADLATRPVTVLDSRTAAAAHGLVVLAAAEAAATGAGLEEVRDVAALAARQVDLVATIDDLVHIRESGRVPSVALGLAEQLGIRPVFRLRRGAVERLGIARSSAAAIRRIEREWRRGPKAVATAVMHAARPGEARELAGLLAGDVLMTEFSPAMGIHTGPGVVGVAWRAASR